MAQPSGQIPQVRQLVVETPRLIIRGAQPSDAIDLHQCFKDPKVMRYWSELPHSTPEVTEDWVGKMIGSKNNGVKDFVICLKSTEQQPTAGSNTVNGDSTNQHDNHLKVIGKVGIWQGNEIGFLIGRDYWGKGLALEAVPEIIDLGFLISDQMNHDAAHTPNQINENENDQVDIVADVDPRNVASLGILKKLGFEVYATKERTFQIGDEWVDSVYLSLKRNVWLEKREEIKALARNRLVLATK